jgi:small-conductance mechanosensitive channel
MIGVISRKQPARGGTATGILDDYPFALKHPTPEVFVSDRADGSVKVKIRVWFPSVWANTQDDIPLCTRILPEFKSAPEASDILIPFPSGNSGPAMKLW